MSEVVTFCHALKLKSPKDGKSYKLEENRQAARDGVKIAGLGQKNTPLVSQRGIKDYNVLI